MPKNDGTIVMEDVRIIFRNFTGKEGKYNREGVRTFGVILPEALAEELAADGWNVKQLQPREEDEDDTPTPWLPVDCGFGGKGRPPRVVQITSRGRTNLSENEVELLDWVDITHVDLMVRPYTWSNDTGKSGIKAYLQSIYVTIEEDPLEAKYAAMDEQ